MHPELSNQLASIQVDEALAAPGLFGNRVELEEWVYPDLFVRFRTVTDTIRLLHIELTNYDFQPPAIEAVDPITREALDATQQLLRGGGQFPHHQLLGRPFLCVTGTRAYYLYDGHQPQVSGERWEARRAEFRLADLIQYLAAKFKSGSWQ